MTSDRQIEANRLNALKSCGPSSPEGRAIVSRNALRHGLLSKDILLDGESKDRFDHLLASLRDEFRPQTDTEHGLVEKLATARWRQLRAWALESATINQEIRNQADTSDDPDPATRAAIAIRTICERSNYLETINRYETRFERQYDRALNQLLKLKKRKNDFAKQTHFD
jgi:hypothetical protein